ncbi:hypothetical protein NG796_15830 [Laspinema sp. A4]|nr:hypothetical protein [Laspinema sp. D2d]
MQKRGKLSAIGIINPCGVPSPEIGMGRGPMGREERQRRSPIQCDRL